MKEVNYKEFIEHLRKYNGKLERDAITLIAGDVKYVANSIGAAFDIMRDYAGGRYS